MCCTCAGKAAGWGFVVIKDSQELFAKCGKVIVGSDKHDTHRPGRATNNTGELEAIHQAILWVQKECPGKVWIRYDSKYARHICHKGYEILNYTRSTLDI